jgi:hypothetical protein
MNQEKEVKNVKNAIDSFLETPPITNESGQELDCTQGVCVIKNDKSIQERINKKIITEDGRQLLI